MSVVVSVQEVGPCRKQLTVEVPAPAVEAETERVIADIGRRVKVPGFRKGKVPRHLLVRRFQKDIESEVVERLLPRYWKQAEAESSLESLLPPEVDRVDDLVPGAPFTFVATVETRPEIALGSLEGFSLPDPEVEPGEMEVEDAVNDVRRRFATWVPVERPAVREDLISAEVTDVTASAALRPEEGEEPAEGAAPGPGKTESVEFEVGSPRVWEELTLAVQGLAAGQETTFTRREGGPEGPEGTAAGPERRFRLRVTQVQERELPPLDDELAKKLDPNLAGAEALREAILGSIRAGKRQQRNEIRETALLDQLRDRHPMELPPKVVRQEVEHMVRDWAEDMVRRGLDLAHANVDWQDIRERMQPVAEKRVKARFLLDAIAEAESIAVDEREFEALLAMSARAQGLSTPALRRSLDEEGRLADLRAQLRRQKTLRRLLGESPAEPPGPSPDEQANPNPSEPGA